MAWASKETVKEIRENLKRSFPPKQGWKFSVTGTNTSKVNVALMRYPSGYNFTDNCNDWNQYHLRAHADRNGYGFREYRTMMKVKRAIAKLHWDESDIMTDYFNCAFYYNMSIGKWDKPAIKAK